MAAASPPDRTTTVPAGLVFFGQFIDHDITLDVTSSLDRVSDAAEITNVRTPTLDLDSVYAAGPEASSFMYDGARLLTGEDQGEDPFSDLDLARVRGVALIGDFRNDENRLISQLHLGMIRYHNHIVEEVENDYPGISESDAFEKAREHCTWHYQWVILQEFLTTMCGSAVVNRILADGPRFFRHELPFIPVEFSAAAYRFGHSMVPERIAVQSGQDAHDLFGESLGFGFTPLPNAEAAVEWQTLMPSANGPEPQMAHVCGPSMSPSLLQLSSQVDSENRSLATRNMLRGQSLLLPSGEAVARRVGIDPGIVEQVSRRANDQADNELPGATPLWFWLLNEAAEIGRETTPGQFEPGEGLGPVGATIVAEVLIGLMIRDPRSWLSTNRNFRPEADQRTIGQLLTATG